ncbi:hypothetical protein HHI36_010565, partial [Cryptolaemus montrouzieri]
MYSNKCKVEAGKLCSEKRNAVPPISPLSFLSDTNSSRRLLNPPLLLSSGTSTAGVVIGILPTKSAASINR